VPAAAFLRSAILSYAPLPSRAEIPLLLWRNHAGLSPRMDGLIQRVSHN
jgi:hypothetical protein